MKCNQYGGDWCAGERGSLSAPEGSTALISGDAHESVAFPGDPGHVLLGFPSCPRSDPHGLGDTPHLKSLVHMHSVTSLLPTHGKSIKIAKKLAELHLSWPRH